ncbi:MAG: pyrophosphatase PpaX [Candidatus Cohnella colombiensis]|uniref:Pyrophosphatase PpaX n=1 Tax=Candidatus Cohnella colombiensis TaxID=3121368 RepID=A0AA95JBV9_9BACL|nr:MAG: pyrophosphatase PpaX [Cohnella sp.]
MNKRITTVLFDLDGTIVDTNELIIQSFMYALNGIVPESFGREHIIPSMGQPLTSQLQEFSGREQVDDLTVLYREYNLKHHDEMVALFAGVAEVIPALRQAGLRVGIVTTKMRATTIRALKLLGIYEYIETIVTIEDVEHPKPHAEPVAKAITALGVEPAATMMVGDSTVDMQSATAAGAIPVGVAWSLKGADILKEAGAAHVIDEMTDLLNLVGIEGVSR